MWGPALVMMADIVDGADGPDPDKTPLSRGLQAIAQGFRLTTKSDLYSVEKPWLVYDALYAYCCMRAVREKDSSARLGTRIRRRRKKSSHRTFSPIFSRSFVNFRIGSLSRRIGSKNLNSFQGIQILSAWNEEDAMVSV